MEQEAPKTSKEMLVHVGGVLRNERMRQGLTCDDISARLRITLRNIENLEAGNIDDLPAMTYVIGYVRSYANLLGMDSVKICADLKASLTAEENNPEFDFVEQKLDQKANAGRTALAALIAAFVIYGGWYSLSTGVFSGLFGPGTVTEDVAVLETTTNALVNDTEEDQVINQETAIEPTFTEVAPRPVTSQPVIETNPVSAESTKLASNTDDDVSKIETGTSVTAAIATNRIPEQEITLLATANSWVEVTRADGSVLTQRLMRSGETYVVPGGDDLFLTTGNAGGLEIGLGDADPIVLGEWGETLRELPLDKTIISQRN